MTKRLAAAVLTVTLLFPVTGYSLGIRIPDQDAKATARGGAFVATADNPSAIYYNPAGITQLDGHNVRAGFYAVSPRFNYTSAFGMKVQEDRGLEAVPQFYYTYHRENSPVAFGLGVYAPYGLSIDWPSASGFRTIIEEASLTYITINPVIAFKPHKTLSLAAGLTVNYGDLEFERGIFAPFTNTDRFTFEGDRWAPGFNLGLLWQPIEQLSFGVKYSSPTTLEFKGDAEAFPFTPRESAKAEFDFPQTIVVGVSYRPNPKWNFEFNVDWTDWDTLNTVTLEQSVSPDVALPFNWKDSFFYEFGVTRYFDNKFVVSVGYLYSENSVPTRDFTPAVPDSDRHIISAGVGYKSDRVSVDLTYQYAWSPDRTVSGSVSPSLIGQTADGLYEFTSHAVALSVGVTF